MSVDAGPVFMSVCDNTDGDVAAATLPPGGPRGRGAAHGFLLMSGPCRFGALPRTNFAPHNKGDFP